MQQWLQGSETKALLSVPVQSEVFCLGWGWELAKCSHREGAIERWQFVAGTYLNGWLAVSVAT
jgi:hypothetical protein